MAFDAPHLMFLVLPAPLAERTPTPLEVRSGVRCQACFDRLQQPLLKNFRARERLEERSGMVAWALNNSLLAAALLSGDPMNPPVGGAP